MNLQLIARLSGLLPALFFLFFLVRDAISAVLEGKLKLLPLLIMMVLSLAAYFLAWKYPKTGGRLMITGSILMGIYLLAITGFKELNPAIWFTLPFLIPGLLFMVSSKKQVQVP